MNPINELQNGKVITGFGFNEVNQHLLFAIIYKLDEISQKLDKPTQTEMGLAWAKCYDQFCKGTCPNGTGCARTLPCDKCSYTLGY